VDAKNINIGIILSAGAVALKNKIKLLLTNCITVTAITSKMLLSRWRQLFSGYGHGFRSVKKIFMGPLFLSRNKLQSCSTEFIKTN